jgi:type IV secretion system protein VirD4
MPKRVSFAPYVALFDPRVSSHQAVHDVLRLHFRRRFRTPVVRLAKAVHTVVFAPTGAGKGVSCLLPWLLACDENAVVVDWKGDLARLAAEARRRMGHEVRIVDPYGVTGFPSDCFNPLDFIDKASPHGIEEANDLAQACVLRTGEEKDGAHWLDSAEAYIAGMTAATLQYGPEGKRSLQQVRQMLSHTEYRETALELMCQSDAWGGLLARMGGQLRNYQDKELASTLTTVNRFMRFLDTPAIVKNTERSTYDPGRLRTGRMTVFLVPSIEHAKDGLLRLWISSHLRAVVRGGLQEEKKVHFKVDEAASLGKLDAINDALDKFRAYGVRLTLYYQSVGQLSKCFPEDKGQTALSNCTQVYFSVQDLQTAEAVSSRLGDKTIRVTSGGTSTGASEQISLGGTGQHSSRTQSWNQNDNWNQLGRRLLQAPEVLNLPGRIAITFTPGCPPIKTRLLRYYEGLDLPGTRFGWLKTFLPSLGLAAFGAPMLVMGMLTVLDFHRTVRPFVDTPGVRPAATRRVDRPVEFYHERRPEYGSGARRKPR